MDNPVSKVDTTKTSEVLQIVSTLYGGDLFNANQIATEKGWIDTKGAITGSGLDLLRAFSDQQGTRSVFRPF